MFLQSGATERRDGFLDLIRIFTDAFDEVKVHFNETFGEIKFLERADLFQFLFFMDHE